MFTKKKKTTCQCVKYLLFICLFVSLLIVYGYQKSHQIEPFTALQSVHRNNFDIQLWTNRLSNETNRFYPNIAIIVEFRSSPLLVSVVENVLANIPSSWPIQIFHSRENLNFIQDSALNQYLISNRIFLQEIDTIKGDALAFTTKLLTNSSFWNLVRGEKILLFQLDSIFCSNSSHKIEDYLQYDYVGAPWHSKFQIPVKVGNGGFSLRSRSKMLSLLKMKSYTGPYHEDVWFSQYLPLVNGTVAPESVAKTFSVETTFYPNPLAVHKPIYLEHKDLKQLCRNCPNIKLILSICK